jgi:hypothetical protein
MDMSAPGIQLNSTPHLIYVQPTIQQYLQGIKEAVISNNLPAARQAFSQLTKAAPSSSQGSGDQANELATRISQGLQAVGNALAAGDLSGAGQAVSELRQNIQSASTGQADQQPAVTTSPSLSGSDVSSNASSSDDSSSDPGPSLSVRI